MIDNTIASDCKFDLFNYFKGNTLALGIFEDRFGKLRRSFSVNIIGECEHNTLTLTETFLYNDGIKQTRVWVIQRQGANNFTGQASDICGTAIGTRHQHHFNWRYKMKLLIGQKPYTVAFNDKLYPLDSTSLFNRATISKWGITLGTVSLYFKKNAN
ncbi:DUF3833 family protein [Gammaproteobacteria bacterium AS21]